MTSDPGDDGHGAVKPPTWIAEEAVVFLRADGERVAGRIALATPVTHGDHCACDVTLDGIRAKGKTTHTICGDTTLQALLLAARFAGYQLHDYRSAGGRVLYPSALAVDDPDDPPLDIDMPLDALFGPLLTHAPRRADTDG